MTFLSSRPSVQGHLIVSFNIILENDVCTRIHARMRATPAREKHVDGGRITKLVWYGSIKRL